MNRVGDLALSATGTGSCPEDEGYAFHDGVAAPAVAYGIFSLIAATILGRAEGSAEGLEEALIWRFLCVPFRCCLSPRVT